MKQHDDNKLVQFSLGREMEHKRQIRILNRVIDQTRDHQTRGRKHRTINKTKMGQKTIERTFTNDNEIMLLGVEATGAAKNIIHKLGFVHAVTCGPPIGPRTKKLLRHPPRKLRLSKKHNYETSTSAEHKLLCIS